MIALTSRTACAAGGVERTQIDVERAVKHQFYGERSELSVAEFRAQLLAAQGSPGLLRREAA